MGVRELTFTNHHMLRQDAANRLMETAADGLLGNFEIGARLEFYRVQIGHRAFCKMQCCRGRIRLK